MTRRIRALSAACLLPLAVCDSPSTPRRTPTDDGSAYWPGATWRTAEPEDVGMDGRRLAALTARIRAGSHGRLHSLKVVRNGYLVVDEQFGGTSGDDARSVQSVTKSVLSLLVGIAVGRGEIAGADAPVLGFFPGPPAVANRDARKEAMTVRDLLTMRGGMDWDEDPYAGSPLQRLNESRDGWVRFVLDWPMREQPGTRWEYSSGGTILLGGVLQAATGETPDAYARRHLFEPIGVTGAQWYRAADGFPHTGGGLLLRPLDMSRVGYLVLRGGRWGERQVVPRAWLDSATARSVSAPRRFGPHPVDYGWLWWLLPLSGTAGDAETVWTASGAGSQWIFVVPRHDLVVVVTGGDDGAGWVAPVGFLYSDVLPSIRAP